MRLYLLIILVLIMTSPLIAQDFVPRSLEKETKNQTSPIQKSKEFRNIIWEEDFDGARWAGTSNNGYANPENAPTGWSIVDQTGNDSLYWRWDTIGPRKGLYLDNMEDCHKPRNPLNSETAYNGFMMLELEYYSTEDNCLNYNAIPMDSYLQYDEGIDFSNYNAVYATYTEWNKFCCGFSETQDAFFQISTDNGNSWTSFSSSQIINESTENGYRQEFNLSYIVRNQTNVIFRFYVINLMMYYWVIDDLKFFEPEDYDLRMLDYWNDYITYMDGSEGNTIEDEWDFTEGFYQYPWFIIQEFKGFHAAVFNFGGEEATSFDYDINIYRNDILQETFTSTFGPLAHAASDTIDFQQVWRPISKGHYTIEHMVSQANETALEDNSMTRELEITDSILSPVDFSKVNTEVSPDNWTNYDEDGDGLGFIFNLPDRNYASDTTDNFYILRGLSVYIGSNTDHPDQLNLFHNGEAKFRASIFRYYDADDSFTEITSTYEVTLSINDTSSVVYTEWAMDCPDCHYIFEGGTLMVTINMYGTYYDPFGRLQTWNIMAVDENIMKISKESCVTVNSTIETGDDVNWVLAGPAIALDIDYTEPYTSITPAAIKQIELFPNPTSGKFTISDIEPGTITIKNVAGQMVYSGELSNNQVDISDQPDGMYFIEVRNGEEVHSGRVIKK
jgi:hypothetical protein